jgi:hypothetical protein
MSSAQGRAAMRIVFATLCRARFARRFWRSALMSMVLGVFSTQLIRMDRVLDRPDFIERRGTSLQMKMQPDPVFTDLQKREKLDKKKN